MTRDQVREEIRATIWHHLPTRDMKGRPYFTGEPLRLNDLADNILAIPGLAIIDEDAELPTFEPGTIGYAVVWGMKKEG